MRYIAHLVKRGDVGTPWHFRAQRFQDWGTRHLGWRQVEALAGSGELGDMLSHRIDFAHYLVGDIARLVADTRRFVDDRGGKPSNLEDWVAILAEFARGGATGVLESTKLATGRGEGGASRDYCEVNGDAGTLVYLLERPNEIQITKRGEAGLRPAPSPCPTNSSKSPARRATRAVATRSSRSLRPRRRVRAGHRGTPRLPPELRRRREGAGRDGRGPALGARARVGRREVELVIATLASPRATTDRRRRLSSRWEPQATGGISGSTCAFIATRLRVPRRQASSG
jgi:hypothetical protein